MNDSRELRGIRRVLRGWSWATYCIVLAASLIPFVIVGRLVVKDLSEFKESGRRDGISMRVDREPASWELPASSAPQTTESLTDTRADGADDNVFTELDRRKAAAALARTGDLPGALAMLNVNRAGRELSKRAADAAVANMRSALPTRWQAQVKHLRTYWLTLAPNDRRTLFPKGQDVRADALTELLQRETPDDRALAAALPDSIAYAFLINVHAGMTTEVTVPSVVIELYLDTLFLDQTRAKRLYWRSPKKRMDYADHLTRYCDALDAFDLWPHLLALGKTAKDTHTMGDASTRQWLAQIWGQRFVHKLTDRDGKALEGYRQFPWSDLRPEAQRLWADRLLRAFSKATEAPLAPATITADRWLNATTRPLNHGYALTAVRSFPKWRRALLEFDYGDAKLVAFDALAILNAGRFYIRPSGKGRTIALENLLKNLNLERRAVISKRFPWLALIAQLGGTAEGIPPYVRKAKGLKPATRHVGKRWRDVTTKDVLAALRKVSAQRGADRKFISAFIALYLENRNMTSDGQQ